MNLLTTTVGECLNKAAMRNPSGVALITAQGGTSLTWQELSDEVHQVARGLLVSGLKKVIDWGFGLQTVLNGSSVF